jgi:hypothetical protein
MTKLDIRKSTALLDNPTSASKIKKQSKKEKKEMKASDCKT